MGTTITLSLPWEAWGTRGVHTRGHSGWVAILGGARAAAGSNLSSNLSSTQSSCSSSAWGGLGCPLKAVKFALLQDKCSRSLCSSPCIVSADLCVGVEPAEGPGRSSELVPCPAKFVFEGRYDGVDFCGSSPAAFCYFVGLSEVQGLPDPFHCKQEDILVCRCLLHQAVAILKSQFPPRRVRYGHVNFLVHAIKGNVAPWSVAQCDTPIFVD